jgi:hypothetical protein
LNLKSNKNNLKLQFIYLVEAMAGLYCLNTLLRRFHGKLQTDFYMEFQLRSPFSAQTRRAKPSLQNVLNE